MTDDQPDRSQIWNLLSYKTLHATASLMYLLQGMELVRGRILPAYNGYPPNIRHGAVCPPELSYVDVPLVDNGPGFDLSEVLGREGEAEQLAFKAWVEETYNIVWESDLRNAVKASFAANDAIRPRAETGTRAAGSMPILYFGGLPADENLRRPWSHSRNGRCRQSAGPVADAATRSVRPCRDRSAWPRPGSGPLSFASTRNRANDGVPRRAEMAPTPPPWGTDSLRER